MINELQIIGNRMLPPKIQNGLDVVINVLDLTITAGDIDGIGITNDVIFSFDVTNYDRYCEIYLVKKLVDGTGDIWRDLRKADRKISPVPNGYQVIEKLCWFALPANTTDLNTITINVRRIV